MVNKYMRQIIRIFVCFFLSMELVCCKEDVTVYVREDTIICHSGEKKKFELLVKESWSLAKQSYEDSLREESYKYIFHNFNLDGLVSSDSDWILEETEMKKFYNVIMNGELTSPNIYYKKKTFEMSSLSTDQRKVWKKKMKRDYKKSIENSTPKDLFGTSFVSICNKCLMYGACACEQSDDHERKLESNMGSLDSIKLNPVATHRLQSDQHGRRLDSDGTCKIKINSRNVVRLIVMNSIQVLLRELQVEDDPWIPCLVGAQDKVEFEFQCSPTEAPTSSPTLSLTGGPTSSPTAQLAALDYTSGGAKTMAPSTLRPKGQQTTESPSAAEHTSTGANGDPHFKTWSGERYDFHGICDLILLSNPNFNDNLGMDIYIRSKKTKQWSYISTAVIRIGVETFEVSGRKDGDIYWVNGIEGDVEGDDTLWDERTNIAGYPIKYQKVHSIQREYVINLGENNEQIIFKTWKDFVRVDVVNPRDEDFTGSMGLIGSYPDGKIVGRFNPLSPMKDRNAFGQEWQVLSSDPKLFHSVEGPQYPVRCVLPTKSSLRRRLSKSEISREDAEVSCSNITEDEERDLCIFDVMATNDKITADAY